MQWEYTYIGLALAMEPTYKSIHCIFPAMYIWKQWHSNWVQKAGVPLCLVPALGIASEALLFPNAAL